MKFNVRDFLTNEEYKYLANYWVRVVRHDTTFARQSDFIIWAFRNGYSYGCKIEKRNQLKPYSSDNAFVLESGKDQGCIFCKNCPQCTYPNGCAAWKLWWTENWNRNIFRGKKPIPRKREVFKYEHPDLVRELQLESAYYSTSVLR